MMFGRLSILFPAAVTAVLCGCAAAPEAEKPEEKPAENAQAVKPEEKPAENAQAVKPEERPAAVFPAELEAPAKALAEKFVNGLAESLKSGDFAVFRAAQPQGSRPFKKEAFAQMRDSLTRRYGKFVSSEYLGKLDQGQVLNFLWKFTFERADGSGRTSRRQIVCWVRTGAVGGEPVIAGFSYKDFF